MYDFSMWLLIDLAIIISLIGIIFSLRPKKTLLFWFSFVLLISITSSAFGYLFGGFGFYSDFFNRAFGFNSFQIAIIILMIKAIILIFETFLFILIERFRRSGRYILLTIFIIAALFSSVYIFKGFYSFPNPNNIYALTAVQISITPPAGACGKGYTRDETTQQLQQLCQYSPFSIGCKRKTEVGYNDLIVNFCTNVYGVENSKNIDGTARYNGIKDNLSSISEVTMTTNCFTPSDLTNALGAANSVSEMSDNGELIPAIVDTNNAAKFCLDPLNGGFYLSTPMY